ncbi:RNA-binding S4 domain-containing protein [Skermania sp. ID1734]|uniref:RNA-binding S4 domain-containing protein n=1 Tax=Skermania sp. ID1734 TaxID=2597516 RepID=UPI0011802B8A|nr:RNA-binding S4 domain-containing protein [Skermania sp. ID1734]TSE00380.1 RNA-binding S4 domain-containing protein [Skermania sp. ID1734]
MTERTDTARVDAWTWAVRLFKTRALAAKACRAGHVRVNGAPAKPAQLVHRGDQIRLRIDGRERIVTVEEPIFKRVGAAVAVQCYTDHSPPPPSREVAASMPIRDRGAGRPTKRDRREIERLMGRTQ